MQLVLQPDTLRRIQPLIQQGCLYSLENCSEAVCTLASRAQQRDVDQLTADT